MFITNNPFINSTGILLGAGDTIVCRCHCHHRDYLLMRETDKKINEVGNVSDDKSYGEKSSKKEG